MWPAVHKESEWRRFDDDVDAFLETSSKRAVDQWLQSMCYLIISMGSGRFSTKQSKTKVNTKITQIRKEFKALKQQFKKVSEEKKTALAEI